MTNKLIEEIVKFRSKQSGKFVSTTHHIERKDYDKIASKLLDHFSHYGVEMVKEGRLSGKIKLVIFE